MQSYIEKKRARSEQLIQAMRPISSDRVIAAIAKLHAKGSARPCRNLPWSESITPHVKNEHCLWYNDAADSTHIVHIDKKLALILIGGSFCAS